MDLAAIVIAVLALLVSAASALFSWRQARAQDVTARIEKDRRAEEIDARAKADAERLIANVTLRLLPPERNTQPKLQVRNEGPRQAEAISVSFDASDDGLAPPITRRWSDLAGDLDPGASRTTGAGLTAETTQRFRATVEWTDGRGRQRRSVQILT